jgi:hypothetical protein
LISALDDLAREADRPAARPVARVFVGAAR